MIKTISILITTVFLFAASVVRADSIELYNGTLLEVSLSAALVVEQ